MLKYYVDASCKHKQGVGSYAIVQGANTYTGIIKGDKLNSGYCELYGIREALKIASGDNAVIYNDNPFVNNLNKCSVEFNERVRRKRYKDKGLLSEVYDLYNQYPSVSLEKVKRKRVRVADNLARKTLREYLRKN